LASSLCVVGQTSSNAPADPADVLQRLAREGLVRLPTHRLRGELRGSWDPCRRAAAPGDPHPDPNEHSADGLDSKARVPRFLGDAREDVARFALGLALCPQAAPHLTIIGAGRSRAAGMTTIPPRRQRFGFGRAT
jgi:hypothetical protein